MGKRVVNLLRMVGSYDSAVVLIGSNLVPLLGVLFWGWNLREIMFLYWAETGVVMFWTVVKILGVEDGNWLFFRIISITTMLLFGGLFMLAHSLFIFGLTSLDSSPALSINSYGQSLLMVLTGVWWPILVSFISHGFSTMVNFFWGNERKKMTTQNLISLPVTRLVTTHVTIIIGGIIFAAGNWRMNIEALVVAKTIVDIWAHVAERRKFGSRSIVV